MDDEDGIRWHPEEDLEQILPTNKHLTTVNQVNGSATNILGPSTESIDMDSTSGPTPESSNQSNIAEEWRTQKRSPTSDLKRKLSDTFTAGQTFDDETTLLAPASPKQSKLSHQNKSCDEYEAMKQHHRPSVMENSVQSGALQQFLNPEKLKNTEEMKHFLKHILQTSDLGKLFGNIDFSSVGILNDYAQFLGLRPKYKCFKCADSTFESMVDLKEHQRICLLQNIIAPSEIATSDVVEANPSRKTETFNQLNEEMTQPKSTPSSEDSAIPTSPSTIENRNCIGPKFRITRKVYQCLLCDTHYENWNLFHHMRQVHKKCICLVCLGVFTSAKNLLHHLEFMHAAKPVMYEHKEQLLQAIRVPCYVMCSVCEHVFSEHDDFTSHSCENYIQACGLCGLKFIHKPNCRAGLPLDGFNKQAQRVKNGARQRNRYKTKNKQPTNGIDSREHQEMPPPSIQITETASTSTVQPNAIVQPEQKLHEELRNLDKLQSVFCFSTTNRKDKTINNNHHLSARSVTPSTTSQCNKNTTFFRQPNSLNADEFLENDRLLVPKLKLKISKEFQTSLKSEESSTESDEEDEDDEEEEDNLNRTAHQSGPTALQLMAAELPQSPPHQSDRRNAHMDIEYSSSVADDREEVDPVNGEDRNDEVDEDVNIEEFDEMKPLNLVPINVLPPPQLSLPPYDIAHSPEPSNGIPLAGEDEPLLELLLNQPFDLIPIRQLLRTCLKASYSFCLYCNHARKIAVDGNSLALHLLAHHRFTATVDSISAEELQPSTIIQRLKSSLEELSGCFFNLDSYDNCDSNFTIPYEKSYECFQCRFYARVHKELYLHNRKMHLNSKLLCLMCKSNFYSYSELVCHMCPGAKSKVVLFELKFRCVLCQLDGIPSAFRLMVHLRKNHLACDVCFEECNDQSKLSSHVWKHKLQHLCYRCNISYRNKADITKHLFWKHGTESYVCKKCLQKKWPHAYHFCIPPSLFICEVCNLTFSRAVALKVHKRLHNDDLPYPCTEEDCEMKFISRKLLLKHVARHNAPVNVIEEVNENTTIAIELESPEPMESTLRSDGPKKKSKKKSKKQQKHKNSSVIEVTKNFLDIIDLPVPNLSESDSSDESDNEKSTMTLALSTLPAFEVSPAMDVVANPAINADDKHTPIVDWDNFKSYHASPKESRSPKNVLLKSGAESSDDSSDSDSSCSCGSNCSCSTSSSGSSSSSSSSGSSDSSSMEGCQKQQMKRTEKRMLSESETSLRDNLSDNIDVVTMDPILSETFIFANKTDPDLIIFESDLETDESETDEEFYDEHPQRLASEILTEKRKQLMLQTCMNPMKNYDIVENSGPSMPEEMVLSKKVKLKKLGNSKAHGNKKYNSDADAPLTRSTRRCIPENFYCYTSDEEDRGVIAGNTFKPTLPPNLIWCKEDLPQTPTIGRPKPLKTFIKLPPSLNFTRTTSDYQSSSFFNPSSLPPSILLSNDTERSGSETSEEGALQIASPSQSLTTTQQHQLYKPATPAIPLALQFPLESVPNSMRYPIMPPAGCRPAREGERVFCYCQCPYDEVSDMIACDGSNCAFEWFHFECVNIIVPPKDSWYCPQCRPNYIDDSKLQDRMP